MADDDEMEEEVERVVPEDDVGEGSFYYNDWDLTKAGTVALCISDTSPVSLMSTRQDQTIYFTEGRLKWHHDGNNWHLLDIYANATVIRVKEGMGLQPKDYIVCQIGDFEVATQVSRVQDVPRRRFLRCVELSSGPMADRVKDISLNRVLMVGLRWATSDEQNELHSAFYLSKWGGHFVPESHKDDVYAYYEELKHMSVEERIVRNAKHYESYTKEFVVEKLFPQYSSGRSAEKVKEGGKALEAAYKKLAPLISLYANKAEFQPGELKEAAKDIDELTDEDLPYALAFYLKRLGPGLGAVPDGAPAAAPAPAKAGGKRKAKAEGSGSSRRGGGAPKAAAAAPKKQSLEGMPQKIDRLEKERWPSPGWPCSRGTRPLAGTRPRTPSRPAAL